MSPRLFNVYMDGVVPEVNASFSLETAGTTAGE